MAFIPTSHLEQTPTGYGTQNQTHSTTLQPPMVNSTPPAAFTNVQSTPPTGYAGMKRSGEDNNPSPLKRARMERTAFQSEMTLPTNASIISRASTLTHVQGIECPLRQTKQIVIANTLYQKFPENMDFFKAKLFLDVSQMDNLKIQELTGEVLHKIKLQIEKSGPASFKGTTHMQLRENLSRTFFVNEQKKDYQGFYIHLCEFARSVLHNDHLRFYDAYRCYHDWREQILREVNHDYALEEPSNLSHFAHKLTILPPETIQLKNVGNLDLSRNCFLEFPRILLTLESVQKLTLSGNSISSLPIGFRNLNCEKLDLSHNKFFEFPKEATRNQYIKKLDLSHNNIPDLPAGVRNMSSLTELCLNGTNIPLSETHQDTKKALDQKGVVCTGYPNSLAWFQTDRIDLFSRSDDCEGKIINLIDASHSSIYGMEYLITSHRIASALIEAHQRGVDVKIVTDGKQANEQYSQISRLERAGISVQRIFGEGIFHHKTMIFDNKFIRGGSYNLSDAAQSKNHEELTFEKNNPERIERFRAQFDRYIS